MSPKPPIVSIVACLMPEMGIGFQGKLPWRLKQEMTYFRQVTTGTFTEGKQNAVIMGRKTWESIPPKYRPLPGRVNVVVSRQHPAELALDTSSSNPANKSSIWLSNSLTKCLELLPQQMPNLERIYVIGGGEIYAQSSNWCDYMLVTEIQHEDPAQKPTMDTFLNTSTIQDLFQRDDGLGNFVPPNVTLPEEPHIRENGYCYKFALYKRRGEPK
ncbi:LANO_0H15368g1_1 [Lachancea nothofagi CBS 11611]|uniref:Dihydrofolate reductase n=1 Tax=Lachancea nothofagi CBS 11611 TaxID=1266666 RepID=A0A1G4KMS6_9SACH|nr:LANO_0H15368g1_1 [Lachancea nothofagi CBS 11611]